MIIKLVKFGNLLSSRELGREAWQAFRQELESRKKTEPIIVDFENVTTFTPSWGDEFFTALLNEIPDKVALRHTSNPSVQATLSLLEEIHGQRFIRES